MLKGIDVSNWDGWTGSGFGRSNTESAYKGADFQITKATQGTWYVNPLCDSQYQRAKRGGKLLGVYHYAEGTNAASEARFFYDNIKGYIGEAIPCLDWERGQNASWGSTSWCWSFAKEFHALSGVWPLIYVQASAIRQAASCAGKCGLWVAGYPDNRNSWDVPSFPYSISPWSTYTIWQYSSSGGATDRNVAQLTKESWKKIANPSGSSKPSTGGSSKPSTGGGTSGGGSSTPSGSTLELVVKVMKGKYGSGDARRKALGSKYDAVQDMINHIASASASTLADEVVAGKYGTGDTRKTALGSRYDEVQKKVNEKMGGGGKSVSQVAKEVIAGKWGNEPQRSKKLKAAGYDASAVQAEVNRQLGVSTPSSRTYTVKRGDTLSGIGAKLGVNWQTIASKNGIRSPYTIYPGQRLKY